MFDDPEQMEFLKGVVEEARGLTEQKVKEKRKLAAKQGKTTIEEDDPEKVCSLESLINLVVFLFLSTLKSTTHCYKCMSH